MNAATTGVRGARDLENGAFGIVELRRYLVVDGERDAFARCFDAYFPEAFQQLGAMIVGQFLERGDQRRFTWLRGSADSADRARVCSSFYDGPVWREHAAATNARMVDSEDVLLLRPLSPGRGVAPGPAVDASSPSGSAPGVVVAHVIATEAGRAQELGERAEPVFAAYRGAGVREAGVLVSSDEPNSFPRHPVRADDGPCVVWLGVVPDEAMLERYLTLARDSEDQLRSTGLLRSEPEVLVLDPTPRSRLRW